jgi:hypothetical protein
MKTLFLTVLLAATALHRGPAPEETRTFGDWIAGCDNLGACTAVSLADGDREQDPAQLVIRWDGARGAQPRLDLPPPAEADGWYLSVDGKQVARGAASWSGLPARRLIGQMSRGQRLELKSPMGLEVQNSSLSGLTAALLFIEDRQGRVGTSESIIRPGPRPPGPLRTASAVLRTPPRSSLPPPAINAAPLFANDGCEQESLKSDVPQIVRLDAKSTLVLVRWRCGHGAYNFNFNAMIADNAGRLRPAQLDFPGGMSGERDSNDLTNAGWDAGRRRLTAHPLGRGIGDCGVHNEYVWDGARFRLALRTVMPECRGTQHFIPVWTATIAGR